MAVPLGSSISPIIAATVIPSLAQTPISGIGYTLQLPSLRGVVSERLQLGMNPRRDDALSVVLLQICNPRREGIEPKVFQ